MPHGIGDSAPAGAGRARLDWRLRPAAGCPVGSLHPDLARPRIWSVQLPSLGDRWIAALCSGSMRASPDGGRAWLVAVGPIRRAGPAPLLDLEQELFFARFAEVRR